MKVIKLWCHIKAAVKKLAYKLIYGSKLKIGKGTTWRNEFHIAIEGGKIDIGDNCFFNNGCSINSLEHIAIGEGTIFGSNSHVYDHNHKFRNQQQSIKDQGYSTGETKIGKHCWIGTNVVILKGVTIGDNVVIGAGCVVDCDIPANSIVKCSGNIEVSTKE